MILSCHYVRRARVIIFHKYIVEWHLKSFFWLKFLFFISHVWATDVWLKFGHVCPPICTVWKILLVFGLWYVGLLSRYRTKWSFAVADCFVAFSRRILYLLACELIYCDLYLGWPRVSTIRSSYGHCSLQVFSSSPVCYPLLFAILIRYLNEQQGHPLTSHNLHIIYNDTLFLFTYLAFVGWNLEILLQAKQ
jgi:hypothetical protein